MTADRALLRRIEAMGVHGKERHWSLMPAELARRLRPRVERVGDGLATLLATSDSLRVNRVVGLGHRGEASEAMIDQLITIYRAARLKRFTFELSPGPQTAAITRWLIKRGFTRHGGYVLLIRDLDTPVARLASKLRVARARRAELSIALAIDAEVFGSPASQREWILAAATAPDTEHYLAFANSTAVASAALYRRDDLAWFGGAATRTAWRGHGAHAALIGARLRRACRLGCGWAWVETSEPARDRPDGSRRNLLRAGFEQACSKPTFLWQER